MEFSDLVQERHSVRKFTRELVSLRDIDQILEAARVAPSADNRQPVRILVIRKPEGMERLKECTQYTFNAPMAIIVCCNRSEAWERVLDEQDTGFIDAAIVGTHIMLAVHDLGLGATWVADFHPGKVGQAFNLPGGVEPVAVFPIGHPAPDSRPSPQHDKRKRIKELVSYETF